MRQFDINHYEMLAALKGRSFTWVRMSCIFGWLKKISLYIPIPQAQKHGSLIYKHSASIYKHSISKYKVAILNYTQIFSKLILITSNVSIFSSKLNAITSKLKYITSKLLSVTSKLFSVTSKLFCITLKYISITLKLFGIISKILEFHLKLLLTDLCYTRLNLGGRNFNFVDKFSARHRLDFRLLYTGFASEQPLFHADGYFSIRMCFFIHDN